MSVYGFFIEPIFRLRIQRWQISPRGWTVGPLKIAIITDLHVGEPWVSLERLEQVVARTNALGADLIVMLGDLPAGHRFVTKPVPTDQIARVLAGLHAPLGVHAVLGNHDWWTDHAAQARGGGPSAVAAELTAAGLGVLQNGVIRIDRPEGAFWLAGLEDQLAIRAGSGRFRGLDDLPGTLAQITDDAPAILLAHEPDIFPNVPDRISLTLSGHTHGGQVRLFGYSPIVPSSYGNRFSYGHIREDGRDLVVSGGIGCSILPVRFGVVPEIAIIELS